MASTSNHERPVAEPTTSRGPTTSVGRPPDKTLCLACNKNATARCGVCENARYCSTQCQRKDWPVHKLLCKTFPDFQDRPGPNFVRGLFFGADEDAPRFVWLERHGKEWFEIVIEIYLGKVRRAMIETTKYLRLDRDLPYTIHGWYNDNFMIDGSPENKPLKRCLGNRLAPVLRGSFLVQGYTGDNPDGKEIRMLDENVEEAIDLDTTALNPFLDEIQRRAQPFMLRLFGAK